jgi:hypothetical protein
VAKARGRREFRRFYGGPTYYNTVGGAFAFPTLQGDPNVRPEEANTWTIGAVIDSPSDAEWVKSLCRSVDFCHIKVDKARGPQSVDIAQRRCFDPAFNPTFGPSSPCCAGTDGVANDGHQRASDSVHCTRNAQPRQRAGLGWLRRTSARSADT